jgi:hypothetical protein
MHAGCPPGNDCNVGRSTWPPRCAATPATHADPGHLRHHMPRVAASPPGQGAGPGGPIGRPHRRHLAWAEVSGQPTVARTPTAGKHIGRRSSPAATAPGLSCFPRMSLLAYRAEQLLSADQPISGHRAAGQWSQAVDACSAVVADQGKWCLRRSWGGVRSFQCPITEPGACRVAAAAGAGLDALPAPGWRQFRGCPRAR